MAPQRIFVEYIIKNSRARRFLVALFAFLILQIGEGEVPPGFQGGGRPPKFPGGGGVMSPLSPLKTASVIPYH